MRNNKRERADKWYIDGLRTIQASRCACCGQARDDLQVAHIQPHAEGCDAVDVDRPENIVLACRPCNLKYLRSTMPVRFLPKHFLEQVAGFILRRLNPKLGAERAAPVDGRGCTILTSQFGENTEVIDWQNSVFGLPNDTICTFRRDVDAEAVMQKFLAEATRSDSGPILPNGNDGEKAKQEMRITINRVGEVRWLATARYWLRGKFYLMPNGNPKWDSFGEFAFNFGVFDSMRVKAERAAAAAQRRQEERDRKEEADRVARAAEIEEMHRKQQEADNAEKQRLLNRLWKLNELYEVGEEHTAKYCELITRIKMGGSSGAIEYEIGKLERSLPLRQAAAETEVGADIIDF